MLLPPSDYFGVSIDLSSYRKVKFKKGPSEEFNMILKSNILLVPFLLTLVACASIAPAEDRKIQYVDNTKATKQEAYNRALAHLGKSFGDANQTIQVRSPEAGQIVAKGLVVCNVLRQFGDVNDYHLHFTFDFQSKDNRVRFLFEDLEMKGNSGRSLAFATNQLTDKEKVEKIKGCLEPMRAGVLGAINGGSGSSKADNW